MHYLSGYVRALAYSPDGRFLVARLRCDDNLAVVLDAATVGVIHVRQGDEEATIAIGSGSTKITEIIVASLA